MKTSGATLTGEKARLNTARKSIDAAKAEVTKTKSRINDMTLRSTVKGRVLYRLAEEGEVLGMGGKVLTLVNLGDVYMEIYLPAQDAVKVKIGAEARIVLDIAPELAARAKVSFVAPEAQFTPKQVETRAERDKLMFRVKLTVPPERVLQYIERVKTGIRGVGYVRLDDSAQWPERLDRHLSETSAASAGTTSPEPVSGSSTDSKAQDPGAPPTPIKVATPPAADQSPSDAKTPDKAATPPAADRSPSDPKTPDKAATPPAADQSSSNPKTPSKVATPPAADQSPPAPK